MFQHVIVPLDGSRGSAEAVPVAARLAKCSGARILLLRVVEMSTAGAAALEPNLTPPSQVLLTSARNALERTAARLRQDGITTAVVVHQGQAADMILATVRQYDDAIVVLRSRNRGGRLRLGLGSVAAVVVRAVAAPVFVLPYGRRALPPPSPYERLPQSPLRILVPLDGSRLAEDALGPACELLTALALRGKGEILLLRVVPTFASESREIAEAAKGYLEEVAGRLRIQCADRTRQTVNSAVVFETEVPLAVIQVGLHGVDGQGSGFDMVVMTTHGEGGLERTILGGVTEQVLYQTHLPVVVVHPSPIERDGGRELDRVMLSSLESFPASDAPGWQPLSI